MYWKDLNEIQMCFQSQGLDSWPVKVAHFLNSTFTWKATLSWHLLWSKSSPHENCCPKWCTALCDCWYTLLVEISAAAWLLLCWFDPQISLQPHDSAVFQQQAPSRVRRVVVCLHATATNLDLLFRSRPTFCMKGAWLLEDSFWSPNRRVVDNQMLW